MKGIFLFSEHYHRQLALIEDHLFISTNEIRTIEFFLDELDRTLSFIAHNPNSPAIHTETGDQSWPISDGRYRIFFKVTVDMVKNETRVFLIDIIDNKMLNQRVYPTNSVPTYDEE